MIVNNVRISIDEGGKPMMSDKEIAIIDVLIEKYKPKKCLEWGSGNSTLYFPKHECIEKWVSVEHNGHYASYLKDKVDKKVQLIFLQDSADNYVHCVEDTFDFILIDGEFRDKCVVRAKEISNDDTIILLHDSARKESKPILDGWKGKVHILSDGENPTRDGFYAHRGLARLL